MAIDQRQAESGFTLVEVIIVLVLLSLLSATVFTALRLGAETMADAKIRRDAMVDTATASQVLTQLLTSAYPQYIRPSLPGMTGRINFMGDAHSLTFVSAAPKSLALGGFALFHVEMAVNGTQRNLVLAARPELAWSSDMTQEILLSHIGEMKLAYFGSSDTGDEIDERDSWQDSWQNRLSLPILIRISVTFPPDDPRRWPDLLINPRISVDQTCQFVQITQSCLGR